MHHVAGAVADHVKQSDQGTGEDHAHLDHVGHHNAPLTGHGGIDKDNNGTQHRADNGVQAEILEQVLAGHDLTGHNADGCAAVDHGVDGAAGAAAVVLIDHLGKGEAVLAFHALCHDHRVNEIAEAGAEAEPDAGQAVDHAVLRAADHHAVADVGADVGAADQQERTLLCGGDILIEVVRFAAAQPANQQHGPHVNDQHQND